MVAASLPEEETGLATRDAALADEAKAETAPRAEAKSDVASRDATIPGEAEAEAAPEAKAEPEAEVEAAPQGGAELEAQPKATAADASEAATCAPCTIAVDVWDDNVAPPAVESSVEPAPPEVDVTAQPQEAKREAPPDHQGDSSSDAPVAEPSAVQDPPKAGKRRRLLNMKTAREQMEL